MTEATYAIIVMMSYRVSIKSLLYPTIHNLIASDSVLKHFMQMYLEYHEK